MESKFDKLFKQITNECIDPRDTKKLLNPNRTPVISYPKAMFHTLTYSEEKDYILSCLHEACKGIHDLYSNEQHNELLQKIYNIIAEIENHQSQTNSSTDRATLLKQTKSRRKRILKEGLLAGDISVNVPINVSDNLNGNDTNVSDNTTDLSIPIPME